MMFKFLIMIPLLASSVCAASIQESPTTQSANEQSTHSHLPSIPTSNPALGAPSVRNEESDTFDEDSFINLFITLLPYFLSGDS